MRQGIPEEKGGKSIKYQIARIFIVLTVCSALPCIRGKQKFQTGWVGR